MTPPRLLVVEDDPQLRPILARTLREYGFAVEAVEDAPQALAALAREPAAIVMTDIRLPGMSGRALLQEISACYPETRGILTSGYPRDHLVDDGEFDASAPFLQKPFKRQDLTACLARVIREAPWVPQPKRRKGDHR